METYFEKLWEEFSIPLKDFIKRRVNNEQDVEDILQIVFISIYKNINNLKQSQKKRAWIYAITRNAIIDFYRSNNRYSYITSLPENMLSGVNIEESLNDEISQCLKTMIQYLPEKYKEAIILTEYQNLTQKELANRIGLSISGAKSRVQRARLLLKEMLMDCCSLEMDHRGCVIDYKHKSKNCKYC